MKTYRGAFKVGLLASAAAGCLFWQPAIAQTTQQAQATTGQGIEEVVVTARKREENVQTIPIAVSVQSGESLQQHQITNLYSLENVVPSLQTQATINQVGAPTFAIRGIGTSVFGPQVESSVGLVIDDVPMSRVQFANIQFFDIDRVEVLRGPQGMLFGKNASAGLVNIVTNDPVLNETDFIAHGQYGSMSTPTAGNTETLDLGVNVAVTEDSALRVTGFFTHDDGYIKNVFQPDQDLGMYQTGARIKYAWEPTSSFKVLLAADYSYENGIGEGTFASSYDTPLLLGGLVAGLNASQGITAGSRNDLQSADGPNHNQFQIWGVSLKAEYDLGGGYTLTNVAGYRAEYGVRNADADGLPIDLLNINRVGQRYNQTTEELRLTSPANQRFTYQAGFFYLHLLATSLDTFQGQDGIPFIVALSGAPAGTPPNCLIGSGLGCELPPPGFYFNHSTIGQQYNSNSTAGYFEGQFKILDSLRLTAGMRYTHDTLNYLSTCTQFPNMIPLAPICLLEFGQPSPASNLNSTEKDNISYRASLDYDIANDVMAYAGYSEGYKGPTFDQTTADLVNDEISSDWELGLKSTLLDDRLRLNLALYSEIFRGFQTQAETPSQTVLTTNAGKLRAKGVELEFTAIPLDGLTLNGGMNYNHTEYAGTDLLPCYIGQPGGPGVIAPNVCNTTTGFTTFAGNQLQNAPRWTETITARYEQPVWEGWSGFIQGNGYFRSPFNIGSPIENPHTEVGASAIFGVSAGAEADDGHVAVSLFVRNLTDKRVPVYATESPAGGLFHVLLGADSKSDYVQQLDADSFRTVGISVDYHM